MTQSAPRKQEDRVLHARTTESLIAGLRIILEKTRSRPWRRIGVVGHNPLQEMILRFLATQPDHSASFQAIIQAMEITGPTMTTAIRALSRRKCVTRSTSPLDRRMVYAQLTRKGLHAIQQPTAWARALTVASKTLSEPERHHLVEAITKIATQYITPSRPTALPKQQLWKQIVSFLATRPTQESSIRDISAALTKSETPIRKALSRLQEREWISRSHSQTNNQVLIIRLTEAGQAHYSTDHHKW